MIRANFDVYCWRLADIRIALSDARFQRQSGRVQTSQLEPKRALKAFGELIRINAMKNVWPVVAALSIGLLLAGNQTSLGEQIPIDLTQWTPPDIGTVSGRLQAAPRPASLG